jgi:hypothetical protein
MNLEKLNKPLVVGQIEFKVAQVTERNGNVWASILAYKDARTDMEVLDEVVGQLNWQNTYQRDSKGVLQCSIGIYDDSRKDWVWKTSNGTESDFESEKGEYSDAFKRAGFLWGVGRMLYDFPQIWVQLAEGDYYERDGKPKVSAKLRPNDWRWYVSDDYTHVRAERKYGSTWKEIFNNQPYKKKDE